LSSVDFDVGILIGDKDFFFSVDTNADWEVCRRFLDSRKGSSRRRRG